MTEQDIDRYKRAAHAIQSGVVAKMSLNGSETTPKHLRVGVNMAMIDSAALATVLIEKGVITADEYQEALARMAEQEQATYEDELGVKLS